MARRCISLILFLSLATICVAPPPPGVGINSIRSNARSAVVLPAPDISNLLKENFEGAGTPPLWVNDSGTPNYDCTAAPCPLEGAESLSLGPADAIAKYVSSPSWNATEVWGFCQSYFVSSVVGGTIFLELRNAADSPIMTIDISGSGPFFFRVNSGSASPVSTVTSIPSDTLLYIWIHYKKVAGANNDIAEIAFSTTGIEPGAGSNNRATLSLGTTDDVISEYALDSAASGGTQVIKDDKVRLSSIQDYGDNPQ